MPLTCTLQAPAHVAPGQPARLQFSLRNTGPQAVDVLVWGTPFEPAWLAPYVTVLRAGTALPYGGASMKRADPQAADYLHIGAGELRRAAVDLAPVFDLSVPGAYQVRPQIVLHDLVFAGQARVPRPREQHVSLALACNAVDFEVRR